MGGQEVVEGDLLNHSIPRLPLSRPPGLHQALGQLSPGSAVKLLTHYRPVMLQGVRLGYFYPVNMM